MSRVIAECDMCRPLEPRHTSHVTPSQPHQSVRVACHTAAQLAATSFCFVNLLIEMLIHSPSCCPLFVSWCGRNYSVDHNCHVDISSGSVMTKRSTAAQWGHTAPHTTGQGHGARGSPGPRPLSTLPSHRASDTWTTRIVRR